MAGVSTASLVRTVPVALLVGCLSALVLVGLSEVAERLQHLVWHDLPDAWGLTGTPPRWWTVVVLTVTGLLVGAVLRWAPGHGGADPTTIELVGPPIPVAAVPGLAVALALGLAGGVSLGPENPIIAVNVSIAVWLFARRRGADAVMPVAVLAVAGTIGALFATPVAAALVLTESLSRTADRGSRLFDRMFPPLVAAGAGALTMRALHAPQFAVDLPAYTDPRAWDLLGASLVAIAAALAVGLGALAFPYVHRAFHGMPNAVVALGLAGLVLGLFGALGGQVTLFKGLDQVRTLVATADDRSAGALVLVALVKVAAILVAAAAGFRGGRIFPSVVVGVAVGLAAAALVPSIPTTVAVAAGTMGAVLAIDRDGWIALFVGTVIVGDIQVLPLLCIALAPLWLVARALPEMRTPAHAGPEFGSRAAGFA